MVVIRTIKRVVTKPFRIALNMIKNLAILLVLITAVQYAGKTYVRSKLDNKKGSTSPRRVRRRPSHKSRRYRNI